MDIKNHHWGVGWIALASFFLCSVASDAQSSGIFGLFQYTETASSVTITSYPPDESGPVIIPSTINFKPVKRIESGAFRQCSSITSVTFPTSLTSIGNTAFFGCYGLAGVTIPSSVTSIEGSAFAFCGLTSVTIPANVTSIGGDAFKGCRGLTAITVNPANTAYSSVDGVLFNKTQTILLQCPGAKVGSVTPPSTVTSIGSSAFYSCGELTNINIPASVTSIGGNAFQSCSRLTSIIIPSAVASIGNGAFSSCGAMTEITVHPSNNAYSSVDGLLLNKSQTTLIQCPGGKAGSINIPSGVASIGSGAFTSCIGLTSVSIPTSVTGIGISAFSYCSGLTSLTIPPGVTIIESNTFRDCVNLTSIILPSSVTTIGSSAFSSCSGLEEISIPPGVSSIASYTFWSCRSLTGVTMPASVTSIGDGAFYDCHSLTNIAISDSITNIGSSAFTSCRSLTSVTIPSSVTSIGDGAFGNCMALESITVHPSNTSYSSVDGILLNKNLTTLIQCPGAKTGSVTIPFGVTTVGRGGFSMCGGLTGVTIPDGVTKIETNAFSGCSGLAGISIPASVTSIGFSAFSGCAGLTGITIPANVTTIGNYAFSSCTGLTNMHLPASVASVGYGAFNSCSSLTEITVAPANSVYSHADGMLCNKNQSILIRCPIGRVGNPAIPSSVTLIDSNAFSNCSRLTGVTIPVGVTGIGSFAFYSCSGLTSITIPASTTSIGGGAFPACGSLTEITVHPSNTAYSSSDGILFNKSQTTLIQYPGGKAGSFTIPANVTSIDPYAFFSCDGLTGVTIPASVTSIGDNAFSYCTRLTAITVATSNSNYSSVEGLLYNKSQTNLIHCPGGKVGNINISAGVMRIGPDAFGVNSIHTSICFLGNAPSEIYFNFPDSATMYFFNSASGFTSPSWAGYPAVNMGTTSPVKPWLIGYGLPYDTDPLSDPNNDGVVILMAYALNLDPKLNLNGSMPQPVMTANQLRLTFYAGSKGIVYSVESCTGLESWSTSSVALSAPNAGKFRTATVNTTDFSRFMRLVVTAE